MKFSAEKYISAIVLAAFCAVNNTYAYSYSGQLSPQNFNKMYHYASIGRGDVLREAVERGLYIDTLNEQGDTGLCIAIKRRDYTAYNAFRSAGANVKHACTYRIYDQYKAFMNSSKVAPVANVSQSKAAAGYYWNKEHSWWPWILGAALVGGGIYAWSNRSGGGHHKKSSSSSSSSSSEGGGGSSTIINGGTGIGLAGYVDKYKRLINSGNIKDSNIVDGSNSNSGKVVNSIKFLPNMLDNYSYLKAYTKITQGASFQNAQGGRISLGDAAIAMAAHGKNSVASNNGNISIEAKNGSIGMVASNGAQAINADKVGITDGSSDDGIIRMVFKGSDEGNALIGMYADTHASIVNYGKIDGSTSMAKSSKVNSSSIIINIGDDIENNVENGTEEEEETEEAEIPSNSGTLLGMSLFDFYNGTDLSSNTVMAQNYGNIALQAGNNNATNAAISLIGMGSYLDDRFLNGINNPAMAEKMLLENYGNIYLAYQKTYNIASDALKLGNGGVIGIRADASASALNQGNIVVDMQATNITSGNDVAAGMLSVHGADLVNGTKSAVYDGQSNNTGGTIQMINEATSGGVFYGLLAAKGSGAQTGLYKWQSPNLKNYGLIDMQVSNSYAMASFAGGDIVNDGVINLGVENGHSYYKNNKGLYAEGSDITEEVSLVNNGIINVYSEESAAIYNAFSGSVVQTNTGSIYLSNKATKSKVFGGNYSTAINTGDILYKVGNSANFDFPVGATDDIGFNVKTKPAASVILSSGEKMVTKQYVVNDETGVITIGAANDSNVDYGGTFGTAGIQVAKQGSARNKGVMSLKMFDEDISQFNVAMWLDSTATAEAFIENYGTIDVDSANSIGMLNDSEDNASATNYGNIYVRGTYDYGMATTVTGANIFNGHSTAIENETKLISVMGEGSIGMYIKNGNAWNYGTINLLADHTTAYQLDGDSSTLHSEGTIGFIHGLDDITFFWMTNGASMEFDYEKPIVIDGYTLGKATTDSSGGYAYFSKSSTAYVTGEKSRLFVAEGEGSGVYNRGTIEVSGGAKAMVARDGGAAYNEMRNAKITVKDSSSVGIFAEGSDSVAGTFAGSNIYVDAGEGLHAEGLALVENGGNITVTKGIGIHLLDGSVTTYTNGENTGNIKVTGSNSTGAKVVSGAHFVNSGLITVQDQAVGIDTDSVVGNGSEGIINVSANSIGIKSSAGYESTGNAGKINVTGENAIGIKGDATNTGFINVNSADAYGVDGYVLNGGEINVQAGVGVKGTAVNEGTITVLSGKGVDGSITNTGTISVESGVGVYGSGTNSGIISTKGDAGVQVTGVFRNSGIISGNGIGVDVSSGSFTNQGNISMTSGSAIRVANNAYAVNTGVINIGNGNGFYVQSGGMGNNTGSIYLSGSGYGAYVESGGSFTNSGLISYYGSNGGQCANIGVGGKCVNEDETIKLKILSASADDSVVIAEDGATFINNGVVDLTDAKINFDDGGEYVVGLGGTYRAQSLSGNVVVGSDVVMDGFQDTYTTNNAFEGDTSGLTAKSQSYMIDATVINKDLAADVSLKRKEFKDLVEEKDLADFFETNYQAGNNKKMYQALKSASTSEEFNAQKESESGKKFYANLPRENMAVMRGLNYQQQQRALADGVDGVYASANYFKTGKDGVDNLSDYDDNVYSASFGAGTAINRHWSVGGGLTAAYADSDYDDIHSSRKNKVLMAFLPIMYQNNRFKFLSTPEVGVGYGSYKRKTLANEYQADTFDIYYGVYNHAEYSIDVKVAELVAEAELNWQGISSDKAIEKGGLNMYAQDSVSLEAGIGLKLRKRIQLAKQRELMLAIGTKYYHEMLDPYKDLSIGTNAAKYQLKGYQEDKNRLRTAAEAAYRDGSFTVSAEVAHNAEKESNVEGNLGVRYNF
ncbi:MAG: hypothetical protein J6W96_04980 [Alphaproteobacteria bacterium]|nr:hypothetical protein [Alphaproteobacteria bacterium]